jgi:hypothetical protein
MRAATVALAGRDRAATSNVLPPAIFLEARLQVEWAIAPRCPRDRIGKNLVIFQRSEEQY